MPLLALSVSYGPHDAHPASVSQRFGLLACTGNSRNEIAVPASWQKRLGMDHALRSIERRLKDINNVYGPMVCTFTDCTEHEYALRQDLSVRWFMAGKHENPTSGQISRRALHNESIRFRLHSRTQLESISFRRQLCTHPSAAAKGDVMSSSMSLNRNCQMMC